MECVVVVGNPFDGLTIYGDPPFSNKTEAVEWAEHNSVIDLEDVEWNVVQLQHTVEEANMDEEGVPAEGRCPNDSCPGVLGSDGFCSHCGSDYQEKDDESNTD